VLSQKTNDRLYHINFELWGAGFVTEQFEGFHEEVIKEQLKLIELFVNSLAYID
jgi:hypothetical protein